jgi:hypothetical protein
VTTGVSATVTPRPRDDAQTNPFDFWQWFGQQSDAPRSPLGAVTFDLLNRPLSATPGASPHVVARGAPALVVDADERDGQQWYRVIAADGSFGWAPGPIEAVVAGLYSPKALWDLSAVPLGEDPDMQGVEVKAALGTVLGASADAFVARLDHLGLPPELNAALLPWLRVEVQSATGFVALPEAKVVWQRRRGEDAPRRPLGLVQRWFLPPETAQAPEQVEQQTCSILSVIREADTAVSLLRCDGSEPKAHLLESVNSDRKLLVEMDADAVSINRFDQADFDGNGRDDLFLEVVSKTSHDSWSELVVLRNGPPRSLLARLPLEGRTWWIEKATKHPTLWLGQATNRSVVARAYRLASSGRLEPVPGWSVASKPVSFVEASRKILEGGGSLRVAEPHRFVALRGFRRRSEAARFAEANPGSILRRSSIEQ